MNYIIHRFCLKSPIKGHCGALPVESRLTDKNSHMNTNKMGFWLVIQKEHYVRILFVTNTREMKGNYSQHKKTKVKLLSKNLVEKEDKKSDIL